MILGVLFLAAGLSTYPAVVHEIHDCDTLTVSVALGFGLSLETSLRVFGVNAPEITGPEKPMGLACRKQLRSWLAPGDEVVLSDAARDKYGRVLAHVRLPSGKDLASELIRGGWAVPWDGNGKKPAFDASGTYPRRSP